MYIVPDVEEFVDAVRRIVYTGFGQDPESDIDLFSDDAFENINENELDETLSLQECISIAKNQKLISVQVSKITREKRFIITEENYIKMIEDFNARLVSNLLSSLVAKGLIESAYSEEDNDFIFWVKEDNKKT